MIPQTHEALMLQYGWRQIKSDAQAAQLIRRELKGMAAEQRRRMPVNGWDFDWMLWIRAGAWFKFYQHADGRRRKRLLIIQNTR